MAIIGIVMAVAAPGVRDLMANQRMKTASFNLVATSMFARSEAVKRGIPVTIKAPSGNNLSNGWCVLIDTTATCSIAAPDTASTMRVDASVAGVSYAFITTAGPITFNRAGRLSSLVKVEITDNQTTSLKRCVTIDVGGGARTSTGACS